METAVDNKSLDSSPRPKPVVLLLLGGWGIAPPSEANAIASAKTPTFLDLIKEYPVALLTTGDKNLNARYLTLGAGREITEASSQVDITLTSVLAGAGLKQLKISETERFADLTHFFNGGAEDKANGEDWKIVSSEAGNHTVKLSLALRRTTKEAIRAIESDTPADLIVVAIPILDLTAASGDFKAVKKAAADLDAKLRNILDAVASKNGVAIITAAGGNAERLRNLATDFVDKEMTDNPVPFLIVGAEFKGKTIGLADPVNDDLSLLSPAGTLADVAPTILRIMGISQPTTMTGHSLIE
jgi:2,3-bisphosphoglycerate-independent phosphoglycerate mutase